MSFNDNHGEAKGYQQKSLKNIDQSSWKHVAKYFGFIETNMGEGLVTELIKNEDEIAETLEDYLFKFGLTEDCLLYTSPSPRDRVRSRMPSSA